MTKIKIYTEEEALKGIVLARLHEYSHSQEELLGLLTPMELPSDEEIDAHVEEDFLNSTGVHKYSKDAQLLMKAMCKAGALWMRDKIQGGNNEQH